MINKNLSWLFSFCRPEYELFDEDVFYDEFKEDINPKETGKKWRNCGVDGRYSSSESIFHQIQGYIYYSQLI